MTLPDAQPERENHPRREPPPITGRQEGRLEGRREGLREGVITARQKAVLDALEIRFGPAPDLIRRSIESVQDEARAETAVDVPRAIEQLTGD